MVDVLPEDGALGLLLGVAPLGILGLDKLVDHEDDAFGRKFAVDGFVEEERGVEHVGDVELVKLVVLAVVEDEIPPELTLFLTGGCHRLNGEEGGHVVIRREFKLHFV